MPRICSRVLHLDDPQGKTIARVSAASGDSSTFFTLFQLETLDVQGVEHMQKWPRHRVWSARDEALTCACPTWEAERDTPKPRPEHSACRCMRTISLQARLEQCDDDGALPAAAGATSGFRLVLSVLLHAGAFELDRRVERWEEEGAASGAFADAMDYEAARAGDRPAEARDVKKALLRLLLGMVETPGSGLEYGPDCCPLTMNRFRGVEAEEVCGGGGVPRARPMHFSADGLLESVSTVSPRAPPVGGAALNGLRPHLHLHPYQHDGISWMVHCEAHPDTISLHPAWLQLVSGSHIFYLHSWTGELSRYFHVTPPLGTSGGMLCDDVGLGKSLQMLGLVLARPPPEDWPVSSLPTQTYSPVPIKTTLLVAPAAILPQWEAEVHKHVQPGALRCCTYLGLGAARSARGPPTVDIRGESCGVEGRPLRSRRARKPAEAIGGSSDHAADGENGGDGMLFEVLAATQRGLFVSVGREEAEEVAVEQCDLCFVSFETLRDELRKTSISQSGLFMPLGALGFWRVILDEAQLVSKETSKAATICSEIWRRHAWIATGTPINAKADELHGLLAFLNTRPFVEPHVFSKLILNRFKDKDAIALVRMRTLLRALCLRRSKHAAEIAAQIELPPLIWETRRVDFSRSEAAAYEVALRLLKRSHAAFARASSSSTRRMRLLGQLNGDLTRVRQLTCHPSVVNANRAAVTSGSSAGMLPPKLSKRTVLAKLTAHAVAARDAARERHLTARAALHVTRLCLAALGADAGVDDGGGAILADLAAFEKESVHAFGLETDPEALQILNETRHRWRRVRAELEDLLDTGEECHHPSPSNPRRRRRGAANGVSKVVRATVEEAAREVARAAAALRDKSSALSYLLGMKDKMGAEGDEGAHPPVAAADEVVEIEEAEEGAVVAQTCPICLDVRAPNVPWSITICGHEGCADCMEQAVQCTGNCPCCKRPLQLHLLYELEAPDVPIASTGSADPQSEYGSKLCALLELVGELQRSGEKCVIFSAWTRLLSLAKDALSTHDIVVASLVGSPEAKRSALEHFATEATVLLVPLFGGASGAGGGGAAGLTLTQASTAVLLEPALQPGIEKQAAGRISRIGQKTAAKVIRLIVHDTIESRILEWQEVRMQEGATGGTMGPLSLNDFVHLLK